MTTARWTDAIPLSDGAGAWVFPEQSLIYTQTDRPAPSVGDVEAMFDFFQWVASTVPSKDAPTLVHDWRSMRTVPREVRSAFVGRRKLVTAQPALVVVAADINPVLRMALRTIALGAQLLTQSVALEIVDDPEPVLSRLGIGLPDPSLHARLRLSWSRTQTPPASSGTIL